MIKNGLYKVIFGGAVFETFGVFALCDGRMSGFNDTGHEYSGSYAFNAARGLIDFDVMIHLAPGVELVTGLKIPGENAKLRVQGEAPLPGPTSRFSIVIADKAVDVAMTYVRPLP